MPWGEVGTGDWGGLWKHFGVVWNRELTTVHSGGSRSQ